MSLGQSQNQPQTLSPASPTLLETVLRNAETRNSTGAPPPDPENTPDPLASPDDPPMPPHLAERFGQKTLYAFLRPDPGLRRYTANQARWAISQLYAGRTIAVEKAVEADPSKPISITDLKIIRETPDRCWGSDTSRAAIQESAIRALALRVHFLIDAQEKAPDLEITRLDKRCINLLETLTLDRDQSKGDLTAPTPREERRENQQKQAKFDRNAARGEFTDAELEQIDVIPYQAPPLPGKPRWILRKEYQTLDWKREVIRDAIKAGRYFPPPKPSVAV
jgi:hypothetical protein